MNKKITRKAMILSMLKKPGTKLTCQEICKAIIKKQKLKDSVAHYLSGSISSILAKMVKDAVLEYSEETGIRGGHLYQLKSSSYE